MMAPLVCCDLDRTLIYSAGALLLDGEDRLAPALTVAEVYQGRPLSFLTRAADVLLAEIAAACTFVPVTTRTMAQYERIRLPGPPPRYAVTTNGGRILVDGEPDPVWSDHLAQTLDSNCSPLAEIAAKLAGPGYAHWMLRLRDAEELFVYAIVERDLLSPADLAGLELWCAERGWTVSLQGRKLYCVPEAITKEAAVAEIAVRSGGSPLIAAGDSLLDRGMLLAADHGLRPAHGELEAAGFLAPQLAVTAARGVLAGEEIARRIHELVFAPDAAAVAGAGLTAALQPAPH
ncbi:HAD family hydrolase [Arthrobacter sp. I2-34]|uniref:HAD family hydrolase n=1 Tax=Arthrobacter hankyongi TaxID=2904801 RepID=A0ABS9L2H5_9MICC|nr:HAD family hydrolase [Arthrobacter hankyongi]MCG2620714.1 HAD family hydrolase [Arthrobacter hankyongi]